jgi:hypothetical protein
MRYLIFVCILLIPTVIYASCPCDGGKCPVKATKPVVAKLLVLPVITSVDVAPRPVLAPVRATVGVAVCTVRKVGRVVKRLPVVRRTKWANR